MSSNVQESETKVNEVEEQEEYSPEIDYKPVIELPLVETKTLEENEDELLKMRARLYRFEVIDEEPGEWKERGTGEIKLMKHKSSGNVRVLMRRDKTLKICANHYVTSNMELKPHQKNDKTWTWSTLADFSDEKPKPELLCIRFKDAEIAQKFKTTFEEAKKLVKEKKTYREGEKNVDEKEDEESMEGKEKEQKYKEKLIEKMEHIKIESKDN